MSEEESNISVEQTGASSTTVSVNVEDIMNPPEPEPQESNIPEKFRNEDGTLNQESLLKSYQELEKNRQDPPKEEETPTPDQVAEEAGFDLNPYYSKFEKGEEISVDDIDAISSGLSIPKDLVESYVSMHTESRKQALSSIEADADARIYNTLGGEDNYKKMSDWAGENLTTDQLAMVNAQLDNPVFAEQGAVLLKSLYETANGKEPSVTVEPTASQSLDLREDDFQSMEEVREAQRDPKYRDGDPRTHREFDRKFARFMARQKG
jgi:hypothetical protein